ncbi:DUF2062 domain-containing protein [Pokkaliibacter plantistimulans]|uniref:DUF2062 domain-containing protein n=1 Tax=Proteobacteria bacterium 228 TaxID=2083153 RepID=A0A2S5KH96_9PROT|nr:DUF2062 domain-containing protein [Pokkaliibacter plantistimulans]PPC74140.1 DUF2062 domain-containing protein [Pokkaliibacter plantistimulans]
MPRKLLKRFIPQPAELKKHRSLRWLGELLDGPNIWHLTRGSVSRACFVGIFCAFLPMPFQMVVAAVFSILCRSNMPLSVALVWLTNPVTMPPVFYFCYRIGAWMLNMEPVHFSFSALTSGLGSSLKNIWEPLLAGSLTCGIVFGCLSYLLMQGFWQWSVRRNWAARIAKRKAAREQQHRS